MADYAWAAAMGIPDAVISATAVETNRPLLTGERARHRPINELRLKRFGP